MRDSTSRRGTASRSIRRHVPRSSGNVFLDIGFPPGKAEHLRVRAHLMMAIEQLIEARGLTQTRAARLFGVTQPRVSDLVRGRIEVFSIDALVEMLGRAGIEVSIRLDYRRRPA